MLFVVYLAIGGRESQSEPAVRVFARAYMHMLLCMSDVDSSKSYQFSNQISKCLNVMIFRMSIECAKHVPFHDFRTKYSTQRPRGVAPGKFSLPLGHSNARWRLAFSYIFVNANS